MGSGKVESGSLIVDIGVNAVGHGLAVESGEEVLGGHGGHAEAGGNAGAGDVGHDDAVVEGEEGVFHCDGLGFGDVESGGAYLTILEGMIEGGGVDDGAAGGVDEDGVGLHEVEFVVADEMVGFRSEVDVDANEVGLSEDGVYGGVGHVVLTLHVFRAAKNVIVEDGHVEALGALGHFEAYASHAEDAEGAAKDVGAEDSGGGARSSTGRL